MIKLIIVEDLPEHQFFFKSVINSDPQLELACILPSGQMLHKEILKAQPDIVMIDLGLPGQSGLDLLKSLKPAYPDIKFMICTVHEEDEMIFEALKAGAQSYIVKKSKPYQIIDAIKELYEGGSPLSSGIAQRLLQYHYMKTQVQESTVHYHITPKEKDILALLARGHSYIEVAEQLFISIKTLKWHIYNIYAKLEVDNRTEALNKYYGPPSAGS